MDSSNLHHWPKIVVNDSARDFFEYLSKREEEKIVVVSHSNWIREAIDGDVFVFMGRRVAFEFKKLMNHALCRYVENVTPIFCRGIFFYSKSQAKQQGNESLIDYKIELLNKEEEEEERFDFFID